MAWRGYEKPSTNSYVSVEGDCFRIGVQNLSPIHSKSVREAGAVVCMIFHSEEFRDSVIAQSWLASCRKGSNEAPDLWDGQRVYEQINQKIDDFSVNPKRPWMAIAQTHKVENRIAISPSQLDKWNSQNLTLRTELINTLAHEITHLVSDDFQDRGHGTAECPDERLVSYGIGDLSARLALKLMAQPGAPADVSASASLRQKRG